MAGPLLYDRVKESTTTTGTGTLTLAGALTGFQAFSVVGNGNTTIFCVYAVDANGNPTGQWEVAIGTYTSSGTTLSRTTVLASSTGSAVSFSAGTKHVALTIPAAFAGKYLNPTNTFANLTAFQDGRVPYPSDGVCLYRDSGSALVPWGPIFPFTDPTLQTWAWVNQGTMTISTAKGGVYLEDVGHAGGYSWGIRKKAAPATPYTITAAFLMTLPVIINPGGTAFTMGGLIWRQSSDGKFVLSMTAQAVGTSGGGTFFYRTVDKYTNVGTYSASYGIVYYQQPSPLLFMRISDDGTNRKVWHSVDGQNFFLSHSVGRTDYITADEVGFGFNTYSGDGGMTLLSWKEA